MKEVNILNVIEELGAMLIKYKDDIRFKDLEIENLKKKIERIEEYANFYSKDKQ